MARRGALTTLALATVLAGCSPATPQPDTSTRPSTAPSSAKPVTAKGTVRTGKSTPLSLRAAATTDSERLGRIPNKTVLTLACRTIGTSVSNGKSSSNAWNRVTYKKKTGYVASVYIDGGDSAVLSLCQDKTAAPTATPSRPADVEQRIVKLAREQVGVTETKENCTKYGGCMPWSSLFVTWVWNKSSNAVPPFSFSGDLYTWGEKHDRSHKGTDGVGPGDLVLTGTGPEDPKSSTRVDIVTEVLADGKLKVVGGDVKNKVAERTISTKGIYGWVNA